jgi:DNA polymerase-1
MPIQGTAADLMKIAMIEVRRALTETAVNGQGIKMLLQVHDELVFEAPNDAVNKIAKIIDEKMEKIHKLCVPIKVETEAGKNWQELTALY